MKKKYFPIIIFLLGSFSAAAQTTLNGNVFDNSNGKAMPAVFVRDNSNRQLTITDNRGHFELKTEVGHIIIFESPGYTSDTLYVADLSKKKIMMESQSISLREVNIASARTTFDPKQEYPEVYTKSKVYILSPTSWFGKDATDARKLKKYFQREQDERHIDAVFNRAYVGSIVPLKGQDLENFMVLYRPTYAFIENNNGPSLSVYINDCYKKYQLLPPSKRMVAKLDTLPMKSK